MSYEEKQKVIEKEMKDLSNNLSNFTKSNEYSKGYSECQKEYEKKLRWIPIEEEMPKEFEKQLLVKNENYNYVDLRFFNHKNQFDLLCKIHNYTHWHPISFFGMPITTRLCWVLAIASVSLSNRTEADTGKKLTNTNQLPKHT